MKKATYVAISTQKGGAGKTTLTVLVASYLHYVKGYNAVSYTHLPAINSGLVLSLYPIGSKSPQQKYYLTDKGKGFLQQ